MSNKIHGKIVRSVLLSTLCFAPTLILAGTARFYGKVESIPASLQKQMMGATMKAGCPVGFDNLRLLRISYWGFDNTPHIGELVVNRLIAADTVATFKQLYANRFPIESMVLPSYLMHHPKDVRANDNTSAFACRKDGQSPNKLSLHSYGIAVDLNPFYNPSVIPGGKVEPANAKQWLNRDLKHKGMIYLNDKTFQIMTQHGWAWGAFFKSGADYQHFEKIVNQQYVIKSLQYSPNTFGLSERF